MWERNGQVKFILKMPDFHVAFRDLLRAVNLRHGTHSFTSLPKEGVMRIFFIVLKYPTALAGSEPANLISKGQHATSRPPKPQTTSVMCVPSRMDITYDTEITQISDFLKYCYVLCEIIGNVLLNI
jgi:hypothetical protein